MFSGLSVCVSIMTMHCAKTAELNKILFGGQTHMCSRNCELDGSAHWRHLVNTVDLSGG